MSDNNDIKIKVEAEDGTEKIVNINVVRCKDITEINVDEENILMAVSIKVLSILKKELLFKPQQLKIPKEQLSLLASHMFVQIHKTKSMLMHSGNQIIPVVN